MYKVIQQNKIIDVVIDPQFIKFLPSGHIAFTDSTTADGFAIGNTLYSFKLVNRADVVSEPAQLKKVSIEEFTKLKFLLDSNQEVFEQNSELIKAQQNTIARLSSICKKKITAGFSIKLSDGETYNFRLSQEDQINLSIIENQLIAGETSFIYHATDHPCKIYNRTDMLKILAAFKKVVLYHTTYFNLAKHYIKSLTDIDQISLFSYGTDISESVEDAVLKQILINGGQVE